MSAAGNTDLTPLEILVLHNANHRGRDKRLTDISFLLNIEDTHTVNYALRKLMKMELLASEKRGKEVFYRTSEVWNHDRAPNDHGDGEDLKYFFAPNTGFK